jgi:hypothetical protein
MSPHRDDLEAAHARIAALEARVRALDEAAPGKRRKRVTDPEDAAGELDAAAATVKHLQGHLEGRLVPRRASRGGWATLALFFAMHGALAWATVPLDGVGTIDFIFSWMVPLVMGLWVYRHGRVIADPSTPLTARGPFGPTLYYRSRRAAAAMLAALVLADLSWVLAVLPTMTRTTHAPIAPPSP